MTPYGLTEEQKREFRRGECAGPAKHKWIGPNFPTPEGNCPFCIDPEVLQAFQAVQVEMLSKQAGMPVRVPADLPLAVPAQVPAPIAEIISRHETSRQRIEKYRSLRNIHRKDG